MSRLVPEIQLVTYLISFLLAVTMTFVNTQVEAVSAIFTSCALISSLVLLSVHSHYFKMYWRDCDNKTKFQFVIWTCIYTVDLIRLIMSNCGFNRSFNSEAIHLAQVVLVITSIEGYIFVMWYFEAPRLLWRRLKQSLRAVAWICIVMLFTMFAFSLIVWLLLHTVSAQTLLVQGIVGNDPLFLNFWTCFLLALQFAEGDSVGSIGRALDQYYPGVSLIFIVYNIVMYFFLFNILVTISVNEYQNQIEGKTPTAVEPKPCTTTDQPKEQV